MDREWTVKIEGKEHVVEVDYGAFLRDPEDPAGQVLFQRDGKLLVDGNELQTWKSGLPKEINFEIEGKPASLRKKGWLTKNLALFLEGQLIKPTK